MQAGRGWLVGILAYNSSMMDVQMGDRETGITDIPDWERLKDEVFCPLCDYNLRMLTVPRCPECGYTFEWPEVLDPRRRLHKYLFEHHPERGFKAFWRTAIGGWRPKRFWTSLHPIQPSYPKRIFIYWLGSVGILLCVLVLLHFYITVHYVNQANAARTNMIVQFENPRGWYKQFKQKILKSYDSIQAYMDDRYPQMTLGSGLFRARYSRQQRGFLHLAIIMLVWPWLTFGSLMVFRWSMRRAKIKTVHVLRCCIYCYDLIMWVGLIFFILIIPPLFIVFLPSITQSYEELIFYVVSVALLIAFFRMWMAYRYYLRFNHPFLTVFASQVIVCMASLELLILLHLISMGF